MVFWSTLGQAWAVLIQYRRNTKAIAPNFRMRSLLSIALEFTGSTAVYPLPNAGNIDDE